MFRLYIKKNCWSAKCWLSQSKILFNVCKSLQSSLRDFTEYKNIDSTLSFSKSFEILSERNGGQAWTQESKSILALSGNIRRASCNDGIVTINAPGFTF